MKMKRDRKESSQGNKRNFLLPIQEIRVLFQPCTVDWGEEEI